MCRLARLALLLLACASMAHAAERVVDIPTRPGVTQRFLYLAPEKPRAAAILFVGGAGNPGIQDSGAMSRLGGNFLARTRGSFVAEGIAVALVDAPSDVADLHRFRTTPEHIADVGFVIAWLRRETGVPVWLVGTSRGTQSAAYVATRLSGTQGPDGVVLTSTILADRRDVPVPAMAVERIAVPVLLVHHVGDGCRACPFGQVEPLLRQLRAAPRKEIVAVTGGEDTGDPCGAQGHHGYRGREAEVVARIAGWITGP
jgi:pimeloyl-ACP methyl ester carboxylesterase